MNLTEQVEIIQEPIDEKGKYNMKYLPDFQIDKATGGIVPRTPKANPSSSIRDWNKTVGKVDGFNTRIEQNEQNINLLAQDISGNTAQINIQAGQISSIVADVDGNTSLIQQNSDAIELRVTTSDFNSQIAVTEGKIAMKTGDTDEVKSQVVVDAINGGTVKIEAKNIQINGTTTFASGYDPTTKETPAGAQAKVDALENDLGDLSKLDKIKFAQLDTTMIQGGYIKTTLLDVDDIFAQNITATGTITSPTLKSSDYDGNYVGWIINDDGIDLGQGKSISLYQDGAIYATHHGYGIIMNNTGLEFYSYIGSNNGRLTWEEANNIDIIGSSIDIEGISATKSFIVDKYLLTYGPIIAQNGIILNESSDIYLLGTGNRIKATDNNGDTVGQFYFDGSNWRIKDINGWRTL